MDPGNRRTFLQHSAAGTLGLAAAVHTRSVAARTAENDRVVMALIGCGGRGRGVAQAFEQKAGARFAYLCDPDENRRGQTAESLASKDAKSVADLRQALDDPEVDAVLVATPDHWHSPAAILACEAGKHVYVEKPCSHNVREGRLLVDAARRRNRLVQHGTQSRSTAMMVEAIAMLAEGVIGPVLAAKAWNIQRRRSIGRGQPGEPPQGLDYDLWVGPAPMIAYQANRCHDGWHWWYHFGTGDMGNDGVHDIDYARWGLGVKTHPVLVSAVGGKYFFDDDQEFPDTQQVAFEYEPVDGGPRRMLIYEQRLWSTNHPHNTDSGVEFYGPGGQMFLSRRGKVELFDEQKRRVELKIEPHEQDQDAHILNFVRAVQGQEKLNAEIELGHLSSSLCHLGNVATRLRRALTLDPAAERVIGDPQADALLGREYRDGHWAVPRTA
jgi:predicted dehydrogenase